MLSAGIANQTHLYVNTHNICQEISKLHRKLGSLSHSTSFCGLHNRKNKKHWVYHKTGRSPKTEYNKYPLVRGTCV